MPAKNVTKVSHEKIEEAVKRYLAGESAAVLAKYYKISRPGFYLWIKKVQAEMLDKAKHANMTPASLEKSDRVTMRVEIGALKAENERLKRKLFEMMIETGKL